jgi:hypothetical protein
MLPGHDGRPMISLAVSRIKVPMTDVVVAILRDHEERFSVTRGLEAVFGGAVRVVIHEQPTRSQAETVAKTLYKAGIKEPFLVKDSDNVFELNDVAQEFNYVCVDTLNNYDSINPRNKSYLQVDHNGVVTNIREKVVISDLFNVGGYYFTNAGQFLEYYDRLSANTAAWSRELYLSDIIGAMTLDGVPFKSRQITGYEDWGTVHEWRRSLLSRKAYLVSLDGFLFERGSQYFRPRYDEVRVNPPALAALKALAEHGNTIIYLSIRPPELRELTENQLVSAGAPAGNTLYGCPVANFTLVTAPHPTLPFNTARAIETSPVDEQVAEKVRGEA